MPSKTKTNKSTIKKHYQEKECKYIKYKYKSKKEKKLHFYNFLFSFFNIYCALLHCIEHSNTEKSDHIIPKIQIYIYIYIYMPRAKTNEPKHTRLLLSCAHWRTHGSKSTKKDNKQKRLNYRIQGHLFTSH